MPADLGEKYRLVDGFCDVSAAIGGQGQAVKLLRRKYPQYQRMAIDDRPMIFVRPMQIKTWRAG